MIKHLILAALIAFSLQGDNCLKKTKYCKRCNNEFYTLIEHNEYKDKGTECIKNSIYNKTKDITENCINGDTSSRTCYECKRGYITINAGKECLELPHCQTEENNRCQTCVQPFAKNDTDGKCEKKPLCKVIKENKCDECIYYYYLNKDGECKSIPLDYCMVGNDTVCTECDTSVSFLDNGVCNKIPEHCTYFKHEEKKCKSCEDLFNPNADETKCVSITIDKCIRATDANTCTKCEEGYYVNDQNKCSKITDYCNVTTFDHTNKRCTYCVEKYYLTTDYNCTSIPIEKCTKAKNKDTCTKCEEGYFVNKNNNCSKIPENCKIISNKQCGQCNDHFYVNTDGTKCESINVEKCLQGTDANTCTKCEEGYYVDNQNKCTKITDNCNITTFDHINKRCQDCFEKYYLTSEFKCAEITIERCIHARNANTCAQCQNKYYVVDGNKCESITIANCLIASDANTCVYCDSGYYVDKQNKCTGLPSHCKTFDYEGKKCSKCDDKYYLKEENNCQPYSIDKCDEQTGEKTCKKCVEGYEPNNDDGKGDKCVQVCMEWQEICTKCDSNYDSFNYGESCEVLDPSKVPPAPKSDEFSSFINFNLVIAALILSLIL